jgi:hypothetical protein
MATDPLTPVRTTTDALRDAEVALERARSAQHTAIAEAARQNAKQADLVRITGLSRERIRQICRAAGIGPAT